MVSSHPSRCITSALCFFLLVFSEEEYEFSVRISCLCYQGVLFKISKNFKLIISIKNQ